MTIRELINELVSAENLDAKVIMTVGNEDEDIFSSSQFEVHLANDDYIELFMSEDAPQQL